MESAGYGAAWLKSQSADMIDRMLQNRRRHPLPPSGVAPLGSLFRSPVRFAVDGFAGGAVPHSRRPWQLPAAADVSSDCMTGLAVSRSLAALRPISAV